MKLGLVTIFGDNYGNKLQNYALQELLTENGNSVETILVPSGRKLHCPTTFRSFCHKFSPSYLLQAASSRFKSRFPYKNERDGILNSIRFSKTNSPKRLMKLRCAAFQEFTEKFIHVASREEEGNTRCLDVYDAFVCGSDQIWNPTYSSTSGLYFLTFAPKCKRIAFAPSFGLSKLPAALHPLYRKWLNGIPHLSVREEAGASIIKELTGRDVPVLPDPTLCLSQKSWEKVEQQPSFDTSSYILTYFLGNETNHYCRFIEHYAENIGAQVINLFDLREPEHYAIGPAEFVWLIHHAKAMFTDSFHGTVFSLIFHTPFVVFDRIESGGQGMSSRIETLLRNTGLENRHYPEVKWEDIGNISFASADSIITLLVAKAKEFLRKSLNEVQESTSKLESGQLSQFVQRKKEECSGCSACVNACPVHCIQMTQDTEGFSYPVIDAHACIHCGRCTVLCTLSATSKETGQEKAFVAYSKEKPIRKQSSSGGIFSELAKPVLEQGGTVYGVGFSGDFQIIHRAVERTEDLALLRGSKYVQSHMETSFEEIRQKLEAGTKVYFSGTPCQVDGLLAFLNKDYNNLITQDILCHGVASPKVWQEYLALKSAGQKVEEVSFRNKTYGWHYFSMNIRTSTSNYIKRLNEDVFLRLFLDNVILRPSCYVCRHKHLHRKSDLTIADAWALKTMKVPLQDDDQGLSLVFANTDKGKNLLEGISERLTTMEVPVELAVKSQTAMTKSVPYNQNRDLFFATAEENGYAKTIEDWFGFDWPYLLHQKYVYCKSKLYKLMKKS